jgi:hypothetical protein
VETAIAASSTVEEVLAAHPGLLGTFRVHGFGALANPVLRRLFASRVTLAGACRLHGVDIDEFLAALHVAVAERQEIGRAEADRTAGADLPPEDTALAAMKTNDLVERHPEARSVMARHFGPGCFTCPAFGMESIAFACMMHDVPVQIFLRDVKAAIQGAAR